MVKAYVPISSKFDKNTLNPQVPPYPDKGVAYAKYSKTEIAKGEYKLIPQTPFDANIYGTIAGVGASLYSFSETGDHFITDIVISASVTSITRFVLVIGRNICNFYAPAGTTTEHFRFTVPLPIYQSNSAIVLYNTPNGAALDTVAINIYGWVENP